MAESKIQSQLICGPIIRHVDQNNVTFWLVSYAKTQFSFEFKLANEDFVRQPCQVEEIQVGERAFVYLIQVKPAEALPANQKISYRIRLLNDTRYQDICASHSDLCYPTEQTASFVVPTRLKHVVHGSCRKPHHPSKDALVQVDQLLEKSINDPAQRPDLLMLSGDQVYVDDVCGPMLKAISEVIVHLGLYHETLPSSRITDSRELRRLPQAYYQREQLLPMVRANKDLYQRFYKAKRKPVFTSVNAQNHLIALNEMLAMYFLVWSPELWRALDLSPPAQLASQFLGQYEDEKCVLDGFIQSLRQVRRVFAHVPVYMIFDDHDVTDDWNLTRSWEESVYQNPYSNRIVGNALAAYWLCQGWGNTPQRFTHLLDSAKRAFSGENTQCQAEFIEQLFDFEGWHYQLNTEPYFMVLDTRTRRWRSESNGDKPSGLMDWEALCEMQQNMLGHSSVILVSAAPVFGNKLIESIQKIFTFFGKALMVDAENWMAHRGTANVILNIFRHHKTPLNFIILSGDVHYSFVYDVSIRYRKNSNKIIQFTCSGLKNEFPKKLLSWFDKLDQILFSENSLLNFFTKRRHMRITNRVPDVSPKQSVYNASSIAVLKLDDEGKAVSCQIVTADSKSVSFIE